MGLSLLMMSMEQTPQAKTFTAASHKMLMPLMRIVPLWTLRVKTASQKMNTTVLMNTLS